ncbi:MAG: TetR/AcrR family transcriptional regulator [bacterium]
MKNSKTNNLQSDRTKTILNAAMKLFSETDFHEVTVDEIAQSVGLSKGTLYLYFKNKEDLFFSIIKAKSNELFTRLENSLKNDLPFEEILQNFIKAHLNFFKENKAYFKIIHSEKCRMTMDDHYRMHDLGIKVFNQFLKHTEKLVQAGKKENSIGNIDTDIAARGLRGILNSFVFQWIFTNEKISIQKETEQIKNLFLYGVSKRN